MYFPISALLIEYLILTIVDTQDSYGYEISQTIKMVADIKESTLYPILKKLEKAGFVTTYTQEYQGRKRKYYSITESGKEQMQYLNKEWLSYRDTIDGIIEEKCLSIYDTHRFLESCKNTRYYELFFILLHTGLRIGEALALEWCDLDFKHEKLRVYKTLNRVTKYYDLKGNELPERYSTIQITTPKKSASNRKVPLTDAVIAAFMSWKEKQDRDKEKLGKNWGKPNILLKKYPGLIFTTSSGRSYLPSSAQTECRRIVGIVNKHEIALAEKENRDPNLMDVHPHIFRHTFVTRCIQSGMDAATVKKIAGHSDEKMTNYYTHIEEEHIDDEYELYIQKYGTET